MGCRFSSSSPPTFDKVRVVQLNGYVEDWEAPVTVGQVTGKPGKQVLCSAAHILSMGSLPPLRPDEVLDAGRLYFLLPHAVFRSDSSPAVLASLVNRLTAIAREGPNTDGPPSAQSGIPPRRRPLSSSQSQASSTWMPDLGSIAERSIERCDGFKIEDLAAQFSVSPSRSPSPR